MMRLYLSNKYMVSIRRLAINFYYLLIFNISRLYSILANNFNVNNSPSSDNPVLVILKPDAMGDYVLFRNFIYCLNTCGYKIVLIGNDSWEEFLRTYDAIYIDTFFPLNRNKFIKNFIYRTKQLSQFGMLKNVEKVLYPCYSRESYVLEDIVKVIPASCKITWFGDTSNQSNKCRENSKSLYTDLYQDDGDIIFEFERNRQFFSRFIGRDLSHIEPSLSITSEKSLSLPERYAFIFLGASASFRQWPVEKYAEVAKHVHNVYGLSIVLGGPPSDLSIGNELENKLCNLGQCLNFVGKTSLIELVELIARSALLISNETAVPHIAVSLRHHNIFVVSNGNHYGRFTPYPYHICNRYFAIYPPELEEMSDESERISAFGRGSQLNIRTISPQRVIREITEHIEL
ncbi:glycosyltransferase family 9 protein [Vibrio mangrovi]|uniref:ADP-heptose--LPS heptosyltransferase 2 n=1 Tax=Vibrio mangrovi TaxID=474394 RepID=A0A1Y6IXF2_9VIBR|nr:glycosyltransferase family 9 protein [Vibrio mangrovi]MDW6002165.1 glycosyltransferase family 9 protein [Vibrio mangrovi]SMS01510.1 ADP-heptose--LPS heptosyltransferase 2 [Vibrio mangrovi]